MFSDLNITPLLASLVATCFSLVWFSKYGFGSTWLKAEGKQKTNKLFEHRDYLLVFVGHFLSAYIIAVLINLGRTSGFLNGTVLDGVVLASWAWLGFSAVATILSAHMREYNNEAIIIELGHLLISLVIIGGIVAY